MSDKYIWLCSSDYSGRPMSLNDQLAHALAASTHGEGELERLSSKLDNTSALLSNLIMLLDEKELLTKKDVDKLFGQDY